MEQLKTFDEIRNELNRIGIARYYYQAVKRVIILMFQGGVFPNKEPIIEVGEKPSEKKWQSFWTYHFYKQMLDDNTLIDAYLLEEPIIPKYGTKIIKNKTLKTIKFYPESKVKYVMIFDDSKE